MRWGVRKIHRLLIPTFEANRSTRMSNSKSVPVESDLSILEQRLSRVCLETLRMLQEARNVFLYADSPLCRAEVGRPGARVLFLGVLDVHCMLNRRLRVVRFVGKHERRAYLRGRNLGFYVVRFDYSRVLRFEGLRVLNCRVAIVAATNPISASSDLAPPLIDKEADSSGDRRRGIRAVLEEAGEASHREKPEALDSVSSINSSVRWKLIPKLSLFVDKSNSSDQEMKIPKFQKKRITNSQAGLKELLSPAVCLTLVEVVELPGFV
jgi:hypothetical protein